MNPLSASVPTSIIVQRPQSQVVHLVLLSHGVGSVPESMLEAAHWFASRLPSAMVVCMASPLTSDISAGRQWFSVQGVTEDNRQARVDEAMRSFLAIVKHWQHGSGVSSRETTIAGFSQGAIMALESSKLVESPAHRVVSIAGRFATLPDRRSNGTTHFVHGGSDAVIPANRAHAAHERLLELGAATSLNIVQGVAHSPSLALVESLSEHFG